MLLVLQVTTLKNDLHTYPFVTNDGFRAYADTIMDNLPDVKKVSVSPLERYVQLNTLGNSCDKYHL